MTVCLRPDRVPVRFAGADAEKLLNDVITGVVRPEPGVGRWWALLSPQGKIQAEGLIGFSDGAFYLDLHRDVADAFLKRMRMYRLRAKVDIEPLGETHRVGWSAEAPDGTATETVADRDVRAGGLGWRLIAPLAAAADWTPDDTPYRRARVAAGIAELGPDFPPEGAFAHDIGMDLLDGIDFAKGCYVGQEVVSRMKHRGTARRRPVLVSGAPPASGEITAGGREAGTLGTVVDGLGIGIVRLDRIGDPEGAEVAGQPVRLGLPPWASYAFGDAVEAE